MFVYRNCQMRGQAPSLVDTSGTTLLIGLSTIHKIERYTSENQEHDNVWSKTMKKMFLFRRISL
jgi:hypothetical protein